MDDVEAFIAPALDAADHLLEWTTHFRQPHSSFLRSIAVWTGAVDHEQRVVRVLGKVSLDHPTIREVDGTRNVFPFECGGSSNIDEDEILREDIAACVDGSPGRRPGNADLLAQRLRALDERRDAREAERRAKREAQELGANAIVGFRVDFENIGSKNKSLLLAYAKGTAVVII